MIGEELLQENDVIPGSRSSYRIIELVGRGGMGAVYRAQREADGTIWALKEMRPMPNTPEDEIAENRVLFKQEAELMAKLDHPNLPVLADYFEFEGQPVMVMEFVAGQTLETRLRETNAPFLEQQVLRYGIQLCRVLDYLHNLNPPIIYRDLKPPNIMITPDGVMKLIDFGVARTYKKHKAKDTIAMGSAGYAPPEQYGKGQTDARSDIYALGATLLHLLTNHAPVPLQPPQPGSICTQNPSVDPETEQIIIKAMSLSREGRYASCSAMEDALLSQLDGPYLDPTANAAPPPVVPPGQAAVQGGVLEPQRSAAPGVAPPTAQQPAAQPSQPVAPPPAGGTACASCGYVNKTTARFCANCGTALTAPRRQGKLLLRSSRGSWEMMLDDESLPYRIGRRDPSQSHYPEIDLAEHDRGIASRHHATIQRDGEFYTLNDLASTNGTLLNGVRIPSFEPQRLRPGDQIKIGEVLMEFSWS
jgi:serine/threonine protein kinase